MHLNLTVSLDEVGPGQQRLDIRLGDASLAQQGRGGFDFLTRTTRDDDARLTIKPVFKLYRDL